MANIKINNCDFKEIEIKAQIFLIGLQEGRI